MKSYSNDAVTQEDVDNVAKAALEHVTTAVSAVDEKQTRQITALRWMLGASFVVNALLALGLRFL